VSVLRILLCDDHPLVRRAIGDALAQALPRATFVECETLAAALTELRDGEPVDLVLLDLSMPGSQGLSGLMRFLLEAPVTPVAVLSASADPDIIERAMECGAAGYFSKSMPVPDIVEALEIILAGGKWHPPIPPASMPSIADEASRLSRLSVRQYDILMRIMEGRLNKQIAAELNVGEQTVKVHVSEILRKLEVSNRTQAALLSERVLQGRTQPPS
jgi:DNA-binding NarL/FixJ family response regulator